MICHYALRKNRFALNAMPDAFSTTHSARVSHLTRPRSAAAVANTSGEHKLSRRLLANAFAVGTLAKNFGAAALG